MTQRKRCNLTQINGDTLLFNLICNIIRYGTRQIETMHDCNVTWCYFISHTICNNTTCARLQYYLRHNGSSDFDPHTNSDVTCHYLRQLINPVFSLLEPLSVFVCASHRLSLLEGRTARWAFDLTAGGEAAAFSDTVPCLHGFIWFSLSARPPEVVWSSSTCTWRGGAAGVGKQHLLKMWCSCANFGRIISTCAKENRPHFKSCCLLSSCNNTRFQSY